MGGNPTTSTKNFNDGDGLQAVRLFNNCNDKCVFLMLQDQPLADLQWCGDEAAARFMRAPTEFV